MIKFIIRRLLSLIPVILGVTFFVFMVMQLAPGDAAKLLLGEGATQEQVEELRQVVPDIQVDPAVFVGVKEAEKVSSPGLKYKHYAPKAKVTLLKGDSQAYARFLQVHQQENLLPCVLKRTCLF